MGVRGLLVDRMSRGTIACLSVSYFVALFILTLGAAFSPERFERLEQRFDAVPAAAVDASVDLLPMSIKGLAPTNQFMVMLGFLERPRMRATGLPVALAATLAYDQTYTFSMAHTDWETGETHVLSNLSHTARVRCEGGSPVCRLGMLAYVPTVDFDTLTIDLNLASPLKPFDDAIGGGGQLSPVINASVVTIKVADRYTRFEIGWRYTGVVLSLLVWAGYTVLLACGPGLTDEATGKRVASTFEQRYIWAMALLVVFFNRPGFATEVVAPSLAAYAFGAVTQITALAALLFFFLFHFHLVALQSEAGASGVVWEVDAYGLETSGEPEGGGVNVPKPRSRRPSPLGPCFYVPKVLIVTLAWAVSLALLLYSRYMQSTDPGFSINETYPEFGSFLRSFAVAIGAFYVLLLLFYVFLGLRKCRSMPRSGVLFTTVTLVTVLLTLAGVFANTFTGTLNVSGFYIVSFGVVNVYIWMLCVFFSPAKRVTLSELARNASALAAGKPHPDDEAAQQGGGTDGAGEDGDAASGSPPSSGGVLGARGDVDAVTADDVAIDAPPTAPPQARRDAHHGWGSEATPSRAGGPLAPVEADLEAEAPDFAITDEPSPVKAAPSAQAAGH